MTPEAALRSASAEALETHMQRLRTILVGLDFENGQLTQGSTAAARQALWLAQHTGARVDFMHSAKGGLSAPDLERANEEVEALRAAHGTGVTTSQLIVDDEVPALSLTRRVLRGEGDLVVIAKRNHGKHDDRKLGSVSIELVRNCPAPVWVIKPDHEPVHGSVLAATDLSAVGDRATEYGAFLAAAEQCDLCVVHAWQVPMELQLEASRLSSEETAARKKEITEAAAAHIRGVNGLDALGDKVELYLPCDSPDRAILQLATERNPDLVVMGTVSRGGIAGVIVGNTAEKLLYKLDCSILTVKPADFACPVSVDSAVEAE